jgi:hypothetical protein
MHVFVNFALREVCTVSLSRHYCSSTLRYVRQVLLPTKKNKLTSSQSTSTADHGIWPLDFNDKNRLKNLGTLLFSSCSTNRFIRVVLVGLLGLPSRNRNCHGQHGHGGAILPNLRKMQLNNMLIPPFYHTGINQAGLQSRAKRLDSHESAHADHKRLTQPASQPSKVELLINLVTSMIY